MPIRKHTAAAVLGCLLLVACGEQGADKKPVSQVAARVNDGEISVHQINFILQRSPGLAPDKALEVKRQILDNLIDQELAVQQAIKAELDRSPQVMQAIEAARREILARAYMEQSLTGKVKPAAEEIQAYYAGHPELFSARRIYRLQEIGIPATPENVAAAREQMSKARNSAELMAGLKAKGIKAAGAVMVKPAEHIALDMLPRLSQLKEGQSALFEQGERAAIVTVIASVPQPLSEEAARPFIEQYLARQYSSELAHETLQSLRSQARIEYVGEFGAEAAEARKAREAAAAERIREAREAREAARQAQAEETEKRAAEARKAREQADAEREKARQAQNAPNDSAIQKGLSTLK